MYSSTSCEATHNPNPLDFRKNCAAGSRGCWPSLYLLGVQKAGTTSVAFALSHCGAVAFGIPDALTGPIENCEFRHGCKEVLHQPSINGHASNNGSSPEHLDTEVFTHLFDITRCHTLEGDDVTAKEACASGRFLEANPLGPKGNGFDGDTPDLTSFLRQIPPAFAANARFAVILREPVSRLLSWYNHVLESPLNRRIAAQVGNPISSFDAYARAMAGKSQGGVQGGAFMAGAYDVWMRQYEETPHLRRSQLLVLEFDDLMLRNPAKNMLALSKHYGLPRLLTSMQKLPEANTKEGPQKLVVIKCSTRDFVWRAYHPHKESLYQTLDRHISRDGATEGLALGRADPSSSLTPGLSSSLSSSAARLEAGVDRYQFVSGRFPRFDITQSVACGAAERSMGGLSQTELASHIDSRYGHAHRGPSES